jgi:predicted adenine nucleotide alpha hydrolase (AANH) superfamily ATPase
MGASLQDLQEAPRMSNQTQRSNPPPGTVQGAAPSVVREKLSLPNGNDKLLLHSCCAPCSGETMEAMLASDIDFTIFFYNPNIHPQKEYELRKEENIRFAEKHGVPFIDADYDTDNWFARARGLENEPERGARCTACFDMRFERTALYAHEHGFKVITSSLGISRWKDMAQINGCGIRAASRYPDMTYWDYNWRKKGGSARMIEISKRENFYQQEYCGCVYSLRDTNRHRREAGRDRIRIGVLYYGKSPDGDGRSDGEGTSGRDGRSDAKGTSCGDGTSSGQPGFDPGSQP